MIALLFLDLLIKKMHPDIAWLIVGTELMGEAFAVTVLIHFVVF